MKKRGLGVRMALLISAVVLGVAGVSGAIPFRQVLARQQAVDLAVEQRDALVAENRRLEAQVAALQTTAEVERLAREHFGLVKPGEVAYVAVPVDDPGATAAPSPTLAELPDTVPWWRSMWNFITGRDLVDG
jgi:cell division protein FtsB